MNEMYGNTNVPPIFIERTGIPETVQEIAHVMYSDEDILLVSAVYGKIFTSNEAKQAVEAHTHKSWSEESVKKLLDSAYKRGVISLEDPSFTTFSISNFFDVLNVLVMSEPERYRTFPETIRQTIDDMYFEKYFNSLAGTETPTEDKVLTLQETLAFIDTMDKQIWLNNCDCRTLNGKCSQPLNVCISLKDGINTMPHRGWSKPISKEEAKAIVRYADELGLVHTANPKGVCNCCKDCCYLLRVQTVRKSNLLWPSADKVAEFDSSICIACGLCVDRCQFEAFTIMEDHIIYGSELCRGCGLCSDKCPAGAINMKILNKDIR